MRAMMAGARHVFERQEYLNKINVFPVPDADTGTNMAATLRSVLDGVSQLQPVPIQESSRTVAESALLGARGNSGVILAQYLYGLSEEIGRESRLTTEQFGRAVQRAVRYAYEALSQPREGTILTVMRDWADWVQEHAHIKQDFAELLTKGLEVANHSLEATREKLAELRQSKVVDAGAQGFVDFLSGITHFIRDGKIRDLLHFRTPVLEEVAHTDIDLADIRYRYCTECLIEGQNIDLKGLRNRIEHFGDSLVLAGSRLKARLHIHTNEPAMVFQQARQQGELVQQKADDMHMQFRVTHSAHPPIALVVDSACDLPSDFIEEHGIHVVPVRLNFGPSSYIDKITITPDLFYQMLGSEKQHPRTSQPSPADFKNLYHFLLSHYESVISIHIPAAVSGTHQNAVAMAREVDADRISVIDGKSLSIGMGAVVEQAARSIAAGKSHREIIREIKDYTAQTKVFVAIPSLKYLMRSGRVSRLKGIVASLLNVKPILELDENGVPQHAAQSLSWKSAHRRLLRMATQFGQQKSRPAFKIAHANNRGLAESMAREIRGLFRVQKIDILPVSPVLGAHAGKGAIAVSIAWEE